LRPDGTIDASRIFFPIRNICLMRTPSADFVGKYGKQTIDEARQVW
jgi:hypothetical protein